MRECPSDIQPPFLRRADDRTLKLPLYIYFNAFAWNKLGYASALSLLLFLLVAGLAWWQFRAARRWVYYAGGAP